MSVHRIVLTGGPCGGKSSAVDELRDALAKEGVAMYFAPEVATILFGGGCTFPGMDGKDKLIAFEVALTQLQQQIEASFTNIALSTRKPSVVIFDRGIMDNAAYLPKDGFEELLAATGLSHDAILNSYDSVLHLVTAADGAEKFYKWGNVKDDAGKDVFRKESPEEARELDRNMAAAWAAHPHVGRIENGGDFKEKMGRAVSFVLKRISEQPGGASLQKDLEWLRYRPCPFSVHRNVLTGGPCGGKSSALEELQKALAQEGVAAYCAPEVATILFGGGCVFPGFDGKEELIAFELALTQLQQQMENSFTRIGLSTGKPTIIFFDRGILDNAAYLPEEGWQSLLSAAHLSQDEILSRYDSVLHLVTAADGAEKFYKWGNVKDDSGKDVYRKESPEDARELDRKIAAAWAAHPSVGLIKNTGGIKEKLAQAAEFILDQVEALPIRQMLKLLRMLDTKNEGSVDKERLMRILMKLDPILFTDIFLSMLFESAGMQECTRIQTGDFVSWLMTDVSV